MIYCIEWTPEMQEKMIYHANFEEKPTQDDIERWLFEHYEIKFNSDYERLDWYKI